MLDVSLRRISYALLNNITLTFPKSSCTALAGPPGSGATTLLKIISGDLRPAEGDVEIGTRNVTALPRKKRPLLFATSSLDAPERWSVEHLLVAAVRGRTLDREDRHHELQLAVDKWRLRELLDRRLRDLSSSERTLANLARIELLRPAIVLLDRLFENANPSITATIADDFYRTMRVSGATVIGAPSSSIELGLCDRIVILERGRVVQEGLPSQVYAQPVSEAAAMATGDVNVVPLVIRGRTVESVIGAWELDAPPFEGSGVALARPGDFAPASRGEESDLIFGVEEASFRDGRWLARGMITGGLILRVELPAEAVVQKGKLIALRYDPRRFTLLQREGTSIATIPTDVVPPLRESR